MATKTKRPVRSAPKETEAKAQTKAAPVNGPADTTANTQPAQADLSIGDLRNLSTIMNVTSTRGTFRANEMAMVGALYNKLQSFLARVSPKDEKADGSAPTETPAKE